MTAILWKQLVETVSERSKRYQSRLSAEDIEDVSQDALIRLLGISDTERLGVRRAYVDRVLRSSVETLRRRRQQSVKEEPMPDESNQDEPAYWDKKKKTPEHQLWVNERANRLMDCVRFLKRELPPDHFVGVMAPVTGVKKQRVADDLRVDRKTVTRRVSKSQQMARDWWMKNYGEEF